MAQAQDSLEDLQKRKAIAEAEKAAIEAETARDEARSKQLLVVPIDLVKNAKDDAMETANSAKAITDAKKQSGVQTLCVQCLKGTRDELRKCLDAAISQEDKKSCQEKQKTRAKACDNGECKIERAQSGK